MIDFGSFLSICILFLYVVTGGVFFRLFLPSLNLIAKGLAAFLLLAQITIVCLAFSNLPISRFERWLWNLDVEGNLVSALATTQFALVGCFALFAGSVAVARPAWQRSYFVAIGFLFLAFAWDEFYDLRTGLVHWHLLYAGLGIVVAAGAVFVALRSPRNMAKWFICFLSGLAISAAGAIIVDSVPWNCETIGGWHIEIDGCLDYYRIEELLELHGIWLAFIAMSGLYVELRAEERDQKLPRVMHLLPPLLILIFAQPVVSEILEYRLNSQPTEIHFESKISINAVRMEIRTDAISAALFLSSNNWHRFTSVGTSIHLVDQVSGQSVAYVDDMVSRRESWKTTFFDPTIRYIPRVEVEFRDQIPANRAYWIVLTLWQEEDGEFIRQKILSSDLPQLSDTQLILDELVIQSDSGPPSATTLATFDNGFALEAVELPACLEPGETVEVDFAWRANSAGSEDFAQFLHFIHAESGAMWNHDQMPLGSRLPTRLWYSGLADSEMWRFSLPLDLPTGEYSLFTGLYRHSDLERARAHSPDGSIFPDARIPVGSMPVQMAC